MERTLPQTRVLIAGGPGMLTDIVRATLDAAADMAVVEARAGGASVEAMVERSGAEVVVLAGPAAAAAEPPPALVRRARSLSVLAVGSDGSESTLYTLRPRRQALGELSPDRLLAAIRGRAAAPFIHPTEQAN